MLADQIQEILPLAESKVLKTNEEYHFNIVHLLPKEGNYQLIMTDGLRSYNQPVNEKNADLKNIELYCCLPDYWNLEVKSWPIYWLERIAQVPQKNKTWFGIGDSMPAGNPAQEMDDEFKANHFILSSPLYLNEEFSLFREKLGFQPLAVIPIFQTEIDYKLRNSHTILFRQFAKKGVTELIDPYRSSACRKRVLGMI
ncbi:MAG: suppressor of fused domain protein [Crocinitomicaceae bacterium]